MLLHNVMKHMRVCLSGCEGHEQITLPWSNTLISVSGLGERLSRVALPSAPECACRSYQDVKEQERADDSQDSIWPSLIQQPHSSAIINIKEVEAVLSQTKDKTSESASGRLTWAEEVQTLTQIHSLRKMLSCSCFESYIGSYMLSQVVVHTIHNLSKTECKCVPLCIKYFLLT